MMDYFSDRELGARARTVSEFETSAWGGLVALIDSYITNGGFGIDFPEPCPDGRGPTGTDGRALELALRAEMPDVEWPLSATMVPHTLCVLDLVEFSHSHVAKPIEGSYHSYFDHSHLAFDRAQGQSDFRERTNRILSRNGMAFTLGEDGGISRLAPPVLDEELRRWAFDTGDKTLNGLLEAAKVRFLSPEPASRRESLEKLWDAWERLKSIERAGDKKASVKSLLDKAADEPTYRELLEQEAIAVTRIGNGFRIRHSEISQVEIQTDDQVDYLFHRLLALIILFLRAR